MTREGVVAAARSWVGTPFVPQAAAKGYGCDCAGLVIGIAKELGVAPADFDPGPYKQQPDNLKMIRLCDQYLRASDPWDLAPADVVAMQWEKEPQHLAIVVDYPGNRLGIVHALRSRGRVVEHILSAKWRTNVIVAAYRLPGVA